MSRYMGQIMAECDCQNQACEMRGYCMADRIEELEAQIEELHYGVTAAHFQGYIQGGQVAEAKLAKAVEALQVFADDANWFDTPDNDGVTMNPTWRGPTFTPEQFARDVIAELTGGQKDD